MKINSLASTPVEEIIACFLTAFEGYFVKLPDDIGYWKSRFITARVDWNLSFGMFQDEKLVGFIINGIDHYNGQLTAYNTGTGVLPDFRGKAIVDQLYATAIPVLKEQGIEKCLLEVLCENERAIKVYKRIGFKMSRQLRTFIGTLPESPLPLNLQKCDFSEVIQNDLYRRENYSWDNSAAAVKISGDLLQTLCLGSITNPEGYFVIDPAGSILQLESRTGDYLDIVQAAGIVAKEVKLKNVDSRRTKLINSLEKFHFSNPVNQYEMELPI